MSAVPVVPAPAAPAQEPGSVERDAQAGPGPRESRAAVREPAVREREAVPAGAVSALTERAVPAVPALAEPEVPAEPGLAEQEVPVLVAAEPVGLGRAAPADRGPAAEPVPVVLAAVVLAEPVAGREPVGAPDV